MKKITVIIPTYNEEESLPILYDRIKKLMDSMNSYEFEILFVNDGSKDKTIQIIKKLEKETTEYAMLIFREILGKRLQ